MAEKRKNTGQDMDEIPVSGRGNKQRPSDVVDIYNIPDKWTKLRFHGPVFPYALHWVQTKNKEGKKTKFPTPCLAFDSTTAKIDRTRPCPWCEHGDTDEVQTGVEYWSNVIVRSLQRQKPEEDLAPTKQEVKTGFKDKDSETWTPNRAVRLTGGTLRNVKELKALNVHEDAEGNSMPYPVSHSKFGCDVQIKKNPEGSKAAPFSVNKGDAKPLSKVERGYLVYDLSELHIVPELAEAKAEYKSWYERLHGKKKSKSEDDDDDESTTKKSKKAIDDDDDEDDEDDEPVAKKSSKKPVKKPVKKVVDDEDLDDEDDDEDDADEPVKKSTKKPVKKVVDDDDDDDEDDEPPPKKSVKKPVKKTAKKPVKKPAKKVVDDDDDDDEDEDD